jgi:hypothetical protein
MVLGDGTPVGESWATLDVQLATAVRARVVIEMGEWW